MVQKRIFFVCDCVEEARSLDCVRLWKEEKALATTTTTMAFLLVVTVVLVNMEEREMYVCGVVGGDDGSHSTVLFVGYFCGKRRAQNSLKAKKCVGLTENRKMAVHYNDCSDTHYSLRLKCMTTMK